MQSKSKPVHISYNKRTATRMHSLSLSLSLLLPGLRGELSPARFLHGVCLVLSLSLSLFFFFRQGCDAGEFPPLSHSLSLSLSLSLSPGLRGEPSRGPPDISLSLSLQLGCVWLVLGKTSRSLIVLVPRLSRIQQFPSCPDVTKSSGAVVDSPWASLDKPYNPSICVSPRIATEHDF